MTDFQLSWIAMDDKLWRQVETIFHEAIELPKETRSHFVKKKVGNDQRLEFEVLTLLKSHESEDGFLEQQDSKRFSAMVDQLASGIGQKDSGLGDDTQRSDGTPKQESPDDLYEQATQDNSLKHDQRTTTESQLLAMVEEHRPDFVVKNVVSRGGMGTVLRVYQRKLDRDVAVKILSSGQFDERMRKRFVRESKLAAQVKSDHVVQIFEVGDDPQLPLLVMELIEGPTLLRYLRTQKQVEPKVAAELTRQVAIGLVAAHEQQLIHRDIKPSNILLEPFDPPVNQESKNRVDLPYRAKLIDFGLAREVDQATGETRDQMFAGTLSYMSPEQLLEPEIVDHRSDIYSLGLTLYQMITGEKPFQGAPHMIIREIELAEPKAPRKLDDRIPRDLESICLKAISKDRNRRYETAKAFANDLVRFLDGVPTEARPVSFLEKSMRFYSRNKKVSILAATAVSLLVLLSISSLVFALTVKNKNTEILSQTRRANETEVQRILDSEPGALLSTVNQYYESPDEITRNLKLEFNSPKNDLNRRFNSAVALSIMDSPRTEFIVDNIDNVFVSPAVCQNIIEAIRIDVGAIDCLKESMESADVHGKAKRIILMAHLGDFQPWLAAAGYREDPTLITELIHVFSDWHGDLIALTDAIRKQGRGELNWTYCHAMHLLDRRSLNQLSFEAAAGFFSELVGETSDFVQYASANQVLQKWDTTAPERLSKEQNWTELPNGIQMVSIEPATTMMGRLGDMEYYNDHPPHEVTITKPFRISSTEITVDQYLAFLNDENCLDEDKPEGWKEWEYSKKLSPTGKHPIQCVSWYDAAKFCNWLSKKQGLKPAYRFTGDMKSTKTENGETIEYEDVILESDSQSYRLPFEHEFELTLRDGTTTRFYYGTNPDYFTTYGLASNRTRMSAAIVKSRLPNRLGVFDLHGNVWEWCGDWGSRLDDSPLVDPIGPAEPQSDLFGKIIRSGGVGTISGETNSEARGNQTPYARYNNCGFRIAQFVKE